MHKPRKEVKFLQMKYPHYDEELEGFTASDGFKEITAREF